MLKVGDRQRGAGTALAALTVPTGRHRHGVGVGPGLAAPRADPQLKQWQVHRQRAPWRRSQDRPLAVPSLLPAPFRPGRLGTESRLSETEKHLHSPLTAAASDPQHLHSTPNLMPPPHPQLTGIPDERRTPAQTIDCTCWGPAWGGPSCKQAPRLSWRMAKAKVRRSQGEKRRGPQPEPTQTSGALGLVWLLQEPRAAVKEDQAPGELQKDKQISRGSLLPGRAVAAASGPTGRAADRMESGKVG